MHSPDVAARLQRQRDQFYDAIFLKHIGASLGDLSPGYAEMLLTTRPEFMDGGVVHAGIISTLVDSVLSHAIRTIVGVETLSVTIEFKTNYLEPAGEGLLVARANAVSVDTDMGTATADVVWNDKIVANGLGSFRLYPGAYKRRSAG